jgi:MFS transporter, SP family, general alpha glucoside:H+ symporter
MDKQDPPQKVISDDEHDHVETTNVANLAADAQFAADVERNMTLWQGMKAYPKAVGWSIVISVATTMDGYDTGFLTALFGLVSINCTSRT